jgi:hypothetical protein
MNELVIDIGISEDDRGDITARLSRLPADTYTPYLETHNSHLGEVSEPMTDSNAKSHSVLRFPRIAARDLEGRAITLPDVFAGSSNLVVVAFRREQQSMVDSWISWFDTISATRPGLRGYEVPVLATRWSPARRFIDGGMARAVRDQEARRRTLTVYTDVRRVTDALAIPSTDTVTVLLVNADGRIRWRTTGSATERAGHELLAVLAAGDTHDVATGAGLSEVEQFEFAFEPRFRPLLAMIGVTPGTAHVTLTPERLVARFGPWTCETAIANVREACCTGPYRWYTAIGARGSFVDRGLTFGTTTKGGVCVLLREPVPGLVPVGSFRHPGITLTLAEPDRFVSSLRRRAGLE